MPVEVTTQMARDHAETDADDAVLRRLIDAAERQVIAMHGPHAKDGVTAQLEGGGPRIYLSRSISTVTSVTECAGIAETETVLATDDYRLWHGGLTMQRLQSGTNPSAVWADRVVVAYTPVDDSDERVRVILDLVKLQLGYQASRFVRVGDQSTIELNYEQERRSLLSSLREVPNVG